MSSHINRTFEVLDIVNCARTVSEIEASGAYMCPAKSGAYSHKQCLYFGVYCDKAVEYITDIDALIDISETGIPKLLWANGNASSESYVSKAIECAKAFRSHERPLRVFVLGKLHPTHFVKDSLGGMYQSKIYLDVNNLHVNSAEELADILQGKKWSDFGL